MSRKLRIATSAAVFLGFLGIFLFQIEDAVAMQCSTCKVRFGCFACGGTTGGGGEACYTLDCSSCTLDGACGSGGGDVEPILSRNLEHGKKTFKISADVISEIAAIHPRFAATLANQNNFGFHVGVYRVFWTPIPLSTLDADAFLHRSQNEDFFLKFNKRAWQFNQRIQAGKLDQIEYVIKVEPRPEGGIILKLEVAKGSGVDPAFKKLSINIRKLSESKESIKAASANRLYQADHNEMDWNIE